MVPRTVNPAFPNATAFLGAFGSAGWPLGHAGSAMVAISVQA